LLTVVARDANDQMLPLAYFVVEVENKETWTWFLKLLVDDLGGPKLCAGITFMSDQQKVSYLVSILCCIFTSIFLLCSLIMTILFYRVYCQHYKNYYLGLSNVFVCATYMPIFAKKKINLGKNVKRLLWKATTCTHPQAWEAVMRDMKEVIEDAFKHSLAIPPRQAFHSLLL